MIRSTEFHRWMVLNTGAYGAECWLNFWSPLCRLHRFVMTKYSICNVSHRIMQTADARRDSMNQRSLARNPRHISIGVFLIFATFTKKDGTLPLFLGIDRRAAVACVQYFGIKVRMRTFRNLLVAVFQSCIIFRSQLEQTRYPKGQAPPFLALPP